MTIFSSVGSGHPDNHMRIPMNVYQGEGTSPGKKFWSKVSTSLIVDFFFNGDFLSRICCDFYFRRSYFFTLFQSNYFETTAIFRSSCLFRATAFLASSFFRAVNFLQQLFFQNSWFLGAKLLLNSHYLRIGSSLR